MDELDVMGLAELPQYAELLGNPVLSSALFHFSLLYLALLFVAMALDTVVA